MKRTRLMMGTLVLGFGMAGAAWAQPAPNHACDGWDQGRYSAYDRDADVARGNGDRDDRWNRGGAYNPYVYQRGDRDDAYRQGNARGDRDDHYARRTGART